MNINNLVKKQDGRKIINDFLEGINKTAAAGRLWGEEGREIALAYETRLRAFERHLPEFEALGFIVTLDTTNKTTNPYQFPRIIVKLERGGKSFHIETRTDEHVPTEGVDNRPKITMRLVAYLEGVAKGAKCFAESEKNS